MSAKNLGQIAGLHIGSTPPSNTTLIWYDDTPAVRRHKVYDVATSQWIVLEKSIITSITYSELTTKAQNTGLSVGEYFMITDKANALALAITRTKVQYTDLQGNILVDDLGTSISYHVTSTNLLIDDVVGVFDETNFTLVFSFNETTPTEDDYILAKGQRQSGDSSVWQFLKFKISQFISVVTGNSLKWNKGLYVNVRKEVEDMADQPNGFVSMQTYKDDMEELQQSVDNIGKDNQEIVENVNQSITNATTAAQIYSKKLPSSPTAATATDIVKGDTLTTIVNKIQRWITQFKIATGIKVSQNFAANGSDLNINNNDTVDSALRKVQGNMENYRQGLKDFQEKWNDYQTQINQNNQTFQNNINEQISDFEESVNQDISDIQDEVDQANARQGNSILVSTGSSGTSIGQTAVTERDHNITFGESLLSALRKFMYMCTQIQNWQIVDGTIRYQKILNTLTHSHTHNIVVYVGSSSTSQAYVDLQHVKIGVAAGKVNTTASYLIHREIAYTDNFLIENSIGIDDSCVVLPQSISCYTRNGFKTVQSGGARFMGAAIFPFKTPKNVGAGWYLVQLLLSFDNTISGTISFNVTVKTGAGAGSQINIQSAKINGSTSGATVSGGKLSGSTSISNDNFNITLDMFIQGSVIDAAYPEDGIIQGGAQCNMEIQLSMTKPLL